MLMIQRRLHAVRSTAFKGCFVLGTLLAGACSSSPTVKGGNGAGTSTNDRDGGTITGGAGGSSEDPGIIGVDNGNDADVSPTNGGCSGDGCFDFGDAGPACGDGTVDPGEQCDDGNSAPGDGCNGQCQLEPYSECPKAGQPCRSTIKCGDGKVSPGEVCDDGNTKDGDGCSKDCIHQDSSYYCPEPGEPCKRLFECGDGRVNGSDECDDGNQEDGDGCSEDCKKEEGWTCRQPGKACTPADKCGNGQLDNDEECDDGNLEPGDGCSGICTQEPYWVCLGTTCESTIICGNGTKDPGETCDDGNVEPFDGCDVECQQDPNYICEVNEPCLKIVDCGDGKVAGDEDCDDGNKKGNDGCSATCKREAGYTCPSPGQGCKLVEYCGDGRIQAGEQCDDGDVVRKDPDVWNDGCSGVCQLETFFDCGMAGDPCMSTISCGNGILEPGEECDDGSNVNPNDGCNNSCQQSNDFLCLTVGQPCVAIQTCGDGLITGTEQCDDGNVINGDGCSSSCRVEGNHVCTTPGAPCFIPKYCGDGKIDVGEECDDGDVVREDDVIWGDGCSGVCLVEPYFECPDEGQPCVSTIECGNGELEPGEECDDGNNEDEEDGCDNDCVQDPEFVCATVGEPCLRVQTCGDGQVTGTEECDDTNVINSDGCSAMCRLEAGWACSTPGASCIEVQFCGDGVLNDGEECDDGDFARGDAVVWNDGCSGVCTLEPHYSCATAGQPCVSTIDCGNGALEPGEQCDDGNKQNNDGCDATCTQDPEFVCATIGAPCRRVQTCGDGQVTGTEECDDGNTEPNDGCTAQCEISENYICPTPGADCYIPFYCGDGQIDLGEQCDDGDVVRNDPVIWNDGCSGDCKIDQYFECETPGQPCVSTIECGNGAVEPGEFCDDGNTVDGDGCEANCRSKTPGWVCSNNVCARLLWCGDGKVSASLGETCDDANTNTNDGCANCNLDPDYRCPTPGAPCQRKPRCGDGNRDPGEQCDHGGLTTAGCQANCTFTPGWVCMANGDGCEQLTCGDGFLSSGEACDDGNLLNDDGCSANCGTIEEGFTCQRAGYPCRAICGDGLKRGLEACDDGDTVPGDGCSEVCAREPNWACEEASADDPSVCELSVCGDGVVEGDEGCDNDVVANPMSDVPIAGDGCGPTCQKEPEFERVTDPDYPTRTLPVPKLRCGDGLITGTTNGLTELADGGTVSPIEEECDDGNTIDGDGCSSTCQVEEGYTCDELLELPAKVKMAVTYRDFLPSTTPTTGHPHFERSPTGFPVEPGIPGALCAANTQASCGWLDAEGKPAFSGGTFLSIPSTNAATRFAQWYRTSSVNRELSGSLVLTPDLTTPAVDDYVYSNPAFFPINGRGFSVDPVETNYHFTTELRYFFKYKGGERLSFTGDDDVFVFVNGRLAVDIGGIHGAVDGQVTLSNAASGDPRFGIEKGGVYEIVLFHAERRTTDSNFKLTLAGFLAPRSFCEPKCGDGFVTPDEECDDGEDNTATPEHNKCTIACTLGSYCGDGATDIGPDAADPAEACDDGVNRSGYGETEQGACAPGCKLPPRCGDGVINGPEACDLGNANGDNGGYNGCTSLCQVGPRCGDGETDSAYGETCDDGVNDGSYGSCTPSCRQGPQCGDGQVQADQGEECDGTADCTVDCTFKCGNGVVELGEECDNGINDGSYAGCTATCELADRCGDGETNIPYETCDEGSGQNVGGYEKCDETCHIDKYCGDGATDGPEECDDRINVGGYGRCAPDCVLGPHCGDGEVDTEWGEQCDPLNAETGDNCSDDCKIICGNGVLDMGEACDDRINAGGYGRCQSDCTMGPTCGDGIVTAPYEACDEGTGPGRNDGGYEECTRFCQIAEFCGDGVVNGEEECDDHLNVGGYDRCNPGCLTGPRCGDGTVQTAFGEQCDPEDPVTGDNCTATCKIRCGNGIIDEGEECDDRINAGGYNRCQADCTMGPTCGDGNVDDLYESCDEGEEGNDGGYNECTAFCQIAEFCGDGVVNGNENCDDRVNVGGYNRCAPGCVMGPTCDDGTVQTQYGEQCDPRDPQTGANCTSQCRLRCGNGIVDEGEECDFRLNPGGYGRCASECKWGPRCGDGKVDAPYEGCDEGTGSGKNDGGYNQCTAFCQIDQYCGDGIKNGPEECDDRVNDGGYRECAPGCVWGERCGDGIVQENWGEQCDPKDPDPAKAANCTNTCKLKGTCGDGIVNPELGEQCDDGANTGAYGFCAPQCQWGPRCGDGVVHPLEECDDGAEGNDGEYSGCTDKCRLAPRCGDGHVDTEAGETCDDGINDNTYGSCTQQCKKGPRCGDGKRQEEWGEQCDGEPNCSDNCRLGAMCGDGKVQKELGEECDDGKNDGGYGECGPLCKQGPRCGDAVVQKGEEQCDDGKNDGGYGECFPGCKVKDRCGDGVVQWEHEECDDGNTVNNDRCTNQCRIVRRNAL